LKRLLAVASVLALAILIWHFVVDWVAFKKWYPDYAETLSPFDGVLLADTLAIAKGGNRRSGLWITCSNDQHVRLGLNTRLPIEKQFARNGTFSGLHMQISFLRENIRTYANIKGSPRLIFEEAKWQRSDESDLLFTPPLSTNDIRTLVQSFVPAAPAIVRVDASETGTEMAGIVDGRAISGFATKCTGDIGF